MRKRTLDTGIHKRVKEIRLKAGKERLQMANILGVTLSSYYKYENGETVPSPAIMMTYVKQFGVSLDWLQLDRGPMHFGEITKALEDVKKLKEENERLKQETENLESEKGALLPEGAVVVVEKDLVELFRYIDENTLFKYELLTHFHKYKAEHKNMDAPVPAIGT